MEPADKFRFLAVGGEDETLDNFWVRNDAASWIISWLMNLDGVDPTIADLLTVELPDAWLWQLIWDPLPEDKDGDALGEAIVSNIVLGLPMSCRTNLGDFILLLQLLGSCPWRGDSWIPARNGRWLKVKLLWEDVIWDPTLLNGLNVDVDGTLFIDVGFKDENVFLNVPTVDDLSLPGVFDIDGVEIW